MDLLYPGSEFELEVELVLLAMGFVHPIHEGMLQELAMDLDARGNVTCDDNKMTSVDGVFGIIIGVVARRSTCSTRMLSDYCNTRHDQMITRYLKNSLKAENIRR